MPFATQTNQERQQAKLKLSLIILLPSLFILAFSFLFLAWHGTRGVLKDSINYQLQETHSRAQSRLDSYLSGLDNLLSSVAENPRLAIFINEDNRQEAKEKLRTTLDHSYGEHLDLLILTRQDKYWANMNSPLYLLGPSLDSIIGDIPFFNQWSSIDLTSDHNSLIAIIQRYPILSTDSGMVVGSLVGGMILNDNLTLLSLLGKDAPNKSLQLLIGDNPVGPTFNGEQLDSALLGKIIASHLQQGKIDDHYFSRQTLQFGKTNEPLQLLVIAEKPLSQQNYYPILYLLLLAITLLLLLIVVAMLFKYKQRL